MLNAINSVHSVSVATSNNKLSIRTVYSLLGVLSTPINTIMAHISIIGDSWGYPKLGANIKSHLYTTSDHTEHQLRDVYGHTVTNRSYGAIGNIESVVRLREDMPKQCDVIIWFGTEAFRDYGLLNGKRVSIASATSQLMGKAYVEFERTRARLDADCILIGGQAPVYPVHTEIVNRCIYTVSDWRSEILGSKLSSHLICHPYIFEDDQITDDSRVRLKHARTVTRLQDQMRSSEHFPDHCHPGGACHRSLAKRLDKIIQQQGYK